MAKDPKVMDVAKPGSSTPDIGSKPMVIGHKKAADTIVSGSSSEAKKESMSSPSEKAAKKPVIVPISHDSDSDDSAKSTEADDTTDMKTKEDSKEPKPTAEEPKVEPETGTTPVKKEDIQTGTSDKGNTDSQDKESSESEDKKPTEAQKKLEQEERLQQMIKEKEYFVPIKKSHNGSGLRTFTTSFVIVTLLGLIIIALLIDAEIVKTDFTLPFDFL